MSKAKLNPGTEFRPPAANDGWLIQKHRDIVQDFCDVGLEEKEYIKEWDAFIQKRRISSEAFIGRALVDFVNEKLSWLLESKARSQEFGKHLTVLIARGLDDDIVKLVQSRLQDARLHQKPADNAPGGTSIQEATKMATHRNSRGCTVCGRAVRGPSLLICANEVNMFYFFKFFFIFKKKSYYKHNPMEGTLADARIINRIAKNRCTMTSAYETKHSCQLNKQIGDVMTAGFERHNA